MAFPRLEPPVARFAAMKSSTSSVVISLARRPWKNGTKWCSMKPARLANVDSRTPKSER
jgi:hypothetical protein